MSVFKKDEPLEKRVKVLEKKVRELEKLLGKKPTKETNKKEETEEEDFCTIT